MTPDMIAQIYAYTAVGVGVILAEPRPWKASPVNRKCVRP